MASAHSLTRVWHAPPARRARPVAVPPPMPADVDPPLLRTILILYAGVAVVVLVVMTLAVVIPYLVT